jgi:hypothetical protein
MERSHVIGRVQKHLSRLGIDSTSVSSSSAFGEIGFTSLDVMTLLLEVQQDFGLTGDWIAYARFPSTVGEFAELLHGLQSPTTGNVDP